MRNMCIGCEKRTVRGSNFLCHACKMQDEQRNVESVDLQYMRDFKIELREVIQELPALRCIR